MSGPNDPLALVLVRLITAIKDDPRHGRTSALTGPPTVLTLSPRPAGTLLSRARRRAFVSIFAENAMKHKNETKRLAIGWEVLVLLHSLKDPDDRQQMADGINAMLGVRHTGYALIRDAPRAPSTTGGSA